MCQRMRPINGVFVLYNTVLIKLKFSLDYVAPIVITLMNDLRCRITEHKGTGVPVSRQAHGCQHENARLQSNLAGEQGKELNFYF